MTTGDAADSADARRDFERFRSYLNLLARLNLSPKLQAKLSPSDLVQQTLMDAHVKQRDFRGETVAQQAAWLRQMLVRNVAKAWRDFHRQKRDVDLEVSLERAVERSSVRLEAVLAGDHPSPSAQVERGERMLLVAKALEELSPAQQDTVILHFFEHLSFDDIGERLGRTSTAVAGLLRRGLSRLRELLKESDGA